MAACMIKKILIAVDFLILGDATASLRRIYDDDGDDDDTKLSKTAQAAAEFKA
jgi:hypothetical protein